MRVYEFKTKSGYCNRVVATSTFRAWQYANRIAAKKDSKIVYFDLIKGV